MRVLGRWEEKEGGSGCVLPMGAEREREARLRPIEKAARLLVCLGYRRRALGRGLGWVGWVTGSLALVGGTEGVGVYIF